VINASVLAEVAYELSKRIKLQNFAEF